MRLKIAVPFSISGGVDCNAKDFTLPMDQVRYTKNSWFRDLGNDKVGKVISFVIFPQALDSLICMNFNISKLVYCCLSPI